MSFVLPWKSIDEFGSCCWKQAVKLPGEEIKEGEILPCHFKCSFSVLFQFITFWRESLKWSLLRMCACVLLSSAAVPSYLLKTRL